MPKPRAKRSPGRLRRTRSSPAIVDQDFVSVRAKLLDLAAFFDRVERHAVADDFRCDALRQAAALLVDGEPGRARRILEALSDPTTEPAATSSGKAATGAWAAPAEIATGAGRRAKA